MPAVVKFKNYLASNSNKYGYYEIESYNHPNLDEEETFNHEVVQAINVMTKSSDDDYFKDYLPRVKNNRIAKEVKIADSSHNLSKAHLLDDEPELQDKLRQKYIKVLYELGVDGISCEKPIVFKDGKWIDR